MTSGHAELGVWRKRPRPRAARIYSRRVFLCAHTQFMSARVLTRAEQIACERPHVKLSFDRFATLGAIMTLDFSPAIGQSTPSLRAQQPQKTINREEQPTTNDISQRPSCYATAAVNVHGTNKWQHMLLESTWVRGELVP